MIKEIIKKLTLTILPLLVSGNVVGETKNENQFNVEIYNYAKTEKIDEIDDAANSLLFIAQYPFAFDGMKKVDIKININNEYKESTSNHDRDNCKIEINYTKELKTLVYKDLTTDLILASLHEIGHCVLGKEILHKAPNWADELQLSTQEKSLLWENLKEKNKKAFENIKKDRDCNKDKKCLPSEVFNKYPPMLAYHEMFADLWSITKYSEISCKNSEENLKHLEEYRIKGFMENPDTLYQSFMPIYYIKDIWECGKKFDFKELTFYTQKGFIDYLSNR